MDALFGLMFSLQDSETSFLLLLEKEIEFGLVAAENHKQATDQ